MKADDDDAHDDDDDDDAHHSLVARASGFNPVSRTLAYARLPYYTRQRLGRPRRARVLELVQLSSSCRVTLVCFF